MTTCRYYDTLSLMASHTPRVSRSVGKRTLVCDYEDYGLTLCGNGARAFVNEYASICVSQACTEGFEAIITKGVIRARRPEQSYDER